MRINKRKSLILLIFIFSFVIISLPLFLAILGSDVILKEWGLISILIIGLAILSMIVDFNKKAPSSKEIALIVVLSAMTAALRLPFAFIPNVQPCTFLIICTGVVFGSGAGFMVGIMTPLISNLFLGHGPWTPLQMYSWGIIGGISGLFKFNPEINRWKLGALGIFSGYFFGLIMNIWFWYTFLYPQNLTTFVVAEAQGLYFDTLHAIGNFAFLTILGNRTLKILYDLKEKFGYRFS
ncbi:ECF transporter S component [[Eubacterium] cellulosolvens]